MKIPTGFLSQIPGLGNALGGALGKADKGPLHSVFKLLGILHPEKLAGCLTADPGDALQSLAEACGFDPEAAAIVGCVTDAGLGNVAGAVDNGADVVADSGLVGDKTAATLQTAASLASFVKM